MMNFENLSEEQQIQINLLAGSAMAGLFRGAGFALTLGGAALKTTTGIAAAVLSKSADVVESVGENGGDMLIGLGETADKKADEYETAVKFCKTLLNSGNQKSIVEMA